MSLTWEVARAGGLMAWGMATASIVWGLALSTRLLRRHPLPNGLLDMHRRLGALAVVFTVVHVGALLLDGYTRFSLTEVLVPFLARWHPTAVAWGIVAFYLLLAVEITSLLRERMRRRWWRRAHWLSFPVFAFATLHTVMSGTDATSTVVLVFLAAMSLPLVALVAIRLGGPPGPVPRSGTGTLAPPSP